ncbi:guanine nucleotide-binding protein-like NSN1 isoform X2 [Silene latifolia]|uniref:guanine nucleotide-binding protein-like NSN1 isoform X2 n=1 Tax=Silene latifolia TaxID=37657 RepID=UPI003D78652A
MVKGKAKSKNKRVTIKKKHQILKKVKEHHKKKAKEAKKHGGLNNSKQVDKDPANPNQWPDKEQSQQSLEARRAIEESEIAAAREHRAQKRKLQLLEHRNNASMENQEGVDEFKDFVKSKDNSDKVFYKELVKVIDLSDVIVEVLDARDPLGTRCVDMEKMVLNSGPSKKIVLLLNKIDLVPREAAEKWLKYLREELPAVAFKCSTQEQRSNLSWKSSKSSKPGSLLQTSECLGAETLIKLLKNYSRSHEIKKSITVGIVGLPNVGKSSLINSLKRCHVVNVGATPGLTRSVQEVQLDKSVKLLDCPGVVMLKSGQNDASIALRNCKRIEKLEDPIGPVKEIFKLCPAEVLIKIFKIATFNSVDDFLHKVATARGKLKKGGIVDVEAAARIVLHDWNEGKIPFYTMPPTRNQGEVPESEEAKIVTALGKEFNIDEVYGAESFIGSLKSVDDFSSAEVLPNVPVNFDEQMVEDSTPNVVGNDVDESMEAAEEEPVKKKPKNAAIKQNENLYVAEGMLNPKMRKAEKKRRKKASKVAASGDAMDDDSDFDFKVDNRQGDLAMKDGNDDGDDFKVEVPMAGVIFDDEQ